MAGARRWRRPCAFPGRPRRRGGSLPSSSSRLLARVIAMGEPMVLAVAHAGEDVRGVALDAHAAAASVALLAAPELVVEKRLVDRDARRETADEGYEGFAVAFAGCGETKHVASYCNDLGCGAVRDGVRVEAWDRRPMTVCGFHLHGRPSAAPCTWLSGRYNRHRRFASGQQGRQVETASGCDPIQCQTERRSAYSNDGSGPRRRTECPLGDNTWTGILTT